MQEPRRFLRAHRAGVSLCEDLKWIKQQPSYLAKGYDQLVDPYLELPEEEIQPPIINVWDPECPLQAVTKEDGSFVASLGTTHRPSVGLGGLFW